MDKEKHSYSVVSGDAKLGRYIGRSPSEAAKKALSSYFRETNKNPGKLRLVLNNYYDNKVYDYKTEIREFDKPLLRKIGNRTIEYRFDFIVKRV